MAISAASCSRSAPAIRRAQPPTARPANPTGRAPSLAVRALALLGGSLMKPKIAQLPAAPLAGAQAGVRQDRRVSTHPPADVPDHLFDDPEREQRWRARFRAPRVSLPEWARDAPDRCVYSSNASGTWEIYAWDRTVDGPAAHRQVTD